MFKLMIPALGLVALSACGYSEEKFGEDMEAEFCAAAVACTDAYYTAEADCTADMAAAPDTECVDYDAKAAKACVDGIAGAACDFGFPVLPADCANVCTVEAAGDDDDDDDDESGS